MDTNFKVLLSDRDAIAVRFSTQAGQVKYYVVRLECVIDEKKHTVVLFDNSHHCSHKHILKLGGHTIEKIWYDNLSYKDGLSEAIKDLEANYTFYRQEFIKWLNAQ